MRTSACMRSTALPGAAGARSRPNPFRAAALAPRQAARRGPVQHSRVVVAGSWWSWNKDGSGSGDAASGGSGGASVGLFPAGKRQARVQLPALMLAVEAADVLDADQRAGAVEDICAAVAAGATAVVLRQGGEGSGELYEAAVRLKELLRGRAALLVADRTDIVDVVGADGALLSPDGLPTVVAKRMLQVCAPAAAAAARTAVCLAVASACRRRRCSRTWCMHAAAGPRCRLPLAAARNPSLPPRRALAGRAGARGPVCAQR